jgi:ADP-ribosylglycohydrolase
MMAGAYYGTGGIPKRWLKKLDKMVLDEIVRLSVELVSLSSIGKPL